MEEGGEAVMMRRRGVGGEVRGGAEETGEVIARERRSCDAGIKVK